MMKILLLVFCLSIQNFAFADRDEQEAIQHWRNAEFSLADFESFVNVRGCRSEGLKLQACIRAFDIILNGKNRKEHYFVTTADWLEKLKELVAKTKSTSVYTVEKDFGFFKIAKRTDGSRNPDQDALQVVLEWRKSIKEELEYWKKVVSENPTNRFTFWAKTDLPIDAIVSFARMTGALTSENQSYKYGTAATYYLTQAVDAHAFFVPISLYQAERSGNSQDYVGVGMSLLDLNGTILVENPFEGSPALQSGIRAKDVLTHVNGVPLEGKSGDEVAQLIRGPENSEVTLVVRRGKNAITQKVVRKKIRRPNVQLMDLRESQSAETKEAIFRISVRDFMTENVCSDVRTAILQAQSSGAKGLILDVRNNGGGDLQEGVCVVGLFVGKGFVLEQRPLSGVPPIQVRVSLASDGKVTEHPKSAESSATEYYSNVDKIVSVPYVVLVNSRSASASEFSSDVIQTHGGILVGERTFGKATVQTGSANEKYVRFATTGRFFTPLDKEGKNRRTTQIVGVSPDVEVYGKPNPTEADKLAYREENTSPVTLNQVSGSPVGPRYPEIGNKLAPCLKGFQNAISKLNRHMNDQISPDFQLLVALDTLKCASK